MVQHCHGAPGIVNALAYFPDSRIDDLLIAAGELTWHAGPLVKGGGLCHGTAGNGFAFLKLFRRTKDEIWLDRARRFAMHACRQSDAVRQRTRWMPTGHEEGSCSEPSVAQQSAGWTATGDTFATAPCQ